MRPCEGLLSMVAWILCGEKTCVEVLIGKEHTHGARELTHLSLKCEDLNLESTEPMKSQTCQQASTIATFLRGVGTQRHANPQKLGPASLMSRATNSRGSVSSWVEGEGQCSRLPLGLYAHPVACKCPHHNQKQLSPSFPPPAQRFLDSLDISWPLKCEKAWQAGRQ